ncbi:TM0106 family RecB-like putative nuclease [Fervidobacterium pennivorans subsp. shakshaketiis]|uniref:TM0106 family RecB-like putative nuclease n=1 Tax=Fervidobacterium pennivorans TaxID=93466 RepID=UPI00355BC720
MVISSKDVKTIYFCPRKAKFEIRHRERNKKSLLSVSNFQTDAFGCILVAEVDEIVSENPLVVKILKTGKKLSEYHMLESAFVGYVIESNGKKLDAIIIESPYYSVSVNWKPYVSRMLSMIGSFCETDEFRVMKTHLCRTCPFSPECFKEIVNSESLTFLHGVKEKTLEKLNSYGINTLKDVINMNPIVEQLLGKEKAKRLAVQTKSIIENRPILIRPVPKISEGLYLDIESYTPLNFDYLFGILDDGVYIPFLASDPSSESNVFKEVVNYISKTNKPVYHFHNYEINRFKKLARRYNVELSKNFFNRFIDVYKLYIDHVALPVPSYSLKSIARYFGFNWRTQLNGQLVVHSYAEYLTTGDKRILQEILTYNEDDVRATEFILKKLIEIIA